MQVLVCGAGQDALFLKSLLAYIQQLLKCFPGALCFGPIILSAFEKYRMLAFKLLKSLTSGQIN